MRGNTPPRMPDIDGDEDDEMELIEFQDGEDIPPADLDDDDDGEPLQSELATVPDNDDEYEYGGEELEEVTLDELEQSLGAISDESRLSMSLHSAPIHSLALHPSKNMATTGSEDDTALLWCTRSGKIFHTVSDHKDTVTEVHFNHDGKYWATGDMSGEIFVHKIVVDDDKEGSNISPGGSQDEAKAGALGRVEVHLQWQYSMGDMCWLFWHPAANILLAGSAAGEVYVWRIPSGDCKILAGEGERCEAAALSHDGKRLFAAYSEGKIKLWDLKLAQVLYSVDTHNPQGHMGGSVAMVASDKDQPLYMSGDLDGKIIFWSNNGPVGGAGADDARESVECVAFAPKSDLKMAASASLEGKIIIWDVAKFIPRLEWTLEPKDEGICKLKWIGDYTIMVATLRGILYAFDARTGAQKFSLNGHAHSVYDFIYNKSDSTVLSISEDHTAKIFDCPAWDE